MGEGGIFLYINGVIYEVKIMRDWNIDWKFKIEDFWIGVFWKRDGNCLDMYICIIPCFPIHFSCWGDRWGMPSLDPDEQNEGG